MFKYTALTLIFISITSLTSITSITFANYYKPQQFDDYEIATQSDLRTCVRKNNDKYICKQLIKGHMYFNLEQYTTAAKYFINATKKINSRAAQLAQLTMAGMYYYGEGVIQNNIEAYKFIKIAQSQNQYDELKEDIIWFINELEKNISIDEIHKGIVLAKEFIRMYNN